MRRARKQDHKHIVHVSSAHPWTDNRIHYRECASLARAGYRVDLVAVTSKVEGPNVDVSVIALPKLSRSLRVTLGSVRAIRTALRTGAYVVHLHDPELAWAIPLLRLRGKTVIYDAHEDLPVQVRNKPYLRGPSVRVMVLLAHLVVRLTRTSSHVVAATEKIAERYEDRVTVVRNYPPLREEETAARDVTERELSAVYIGAISTMRGGRVMVDAVARPDFPQGWRLSLAGIVAPSLLVQLSNSPGWGMTDFHGQLPPQDARDVLLKARVGLVLLQDTPAYRDSLPTKMFEYFAAGLPVIASDFPLWRTIVVNGDCGILVDERSPSAVANAVRRYSEDPDLLKRHSENARALALGQLNWTKEAERLVQLYDGLTA